MGMTIVLYKTDKEENVDYTLKEMAVDWVYERECDKILGKSLLYDVLNDKQAKDTIDDLSELGAKIGAKQETEDGITYPSSIEDMVGRLINMAKKHPKATWTIT